MTSPGHMPGGLFYLPSTIAKYATVGLASIYGFWPKSVFSYQKKAKYIKKVNKSVDYYL